MLRTLTLIAGFALAAPAIGQTCTTTPTYGGGYETRCDGGSHYETRPSYGGSWQTYEKPGNPYAKPNGGGVTGFGEQQFEELPDYYERDSRSLCSGDCFSDSW